MSQRPAKLYEFTRTHADARQQEARGVFEALRRDGRWAIAKCPLKSSYAARPEYGEALDGSPRTDGRMRTALLGNDIPRLSNACPKGISNFAGSVRS